MTEDNDNRRIAADPYKVEILLAKLDARLEHLEKNIDEKFFANEKYIKLQMDHIMEFTQNVSEKFNMKLENHACANTEAEKNITAKIQDLEERIKTLESIPTVNRKVWVERFFTVVLGGGLISAIIALLQYLATKQ